MLKDPIEIVCGNLDAEIGTPRDIQEQLKTNNVDFGQELPIPLPESNGCKNGEVAMQVD